VPYLVWEIVDGLFTWDLCKIVPALHSGVPVFHTVTLVNPLSLLMHEKYSSLTEHECVKLVWIPTKLISDEIEYDVIFSVQNIMK